MSDPSSYTATAQGAEHVHFAFDANRPGWTTPIFNMRGERVGDPMEISELERRAKRIREQDNG